ncbi:MAG: hypothetical protein OXE87_04820 [Chloroflexi bacterium]|nr:hypothetical protein [Chloroflexota bacterium]
MPTLSPAEAQVRSEGKELSRAVRDLEVEIYRVAERCWPEKKGLRLAEETRRLAEDTDRKFDGDWVVHRRDLTELEGKLRPILRELESCEVDRETAIRRRLRSASVDLTDTTVLLATRGFVSAFSFYAVFGLITGGLCGRYMVGLTTWRGLFYGLVVTAQTAVVAAFVPFLGREFVPLVVWYGLVIFGTAAVCWRAARWRATRLGTDSAGQ